MGKQKDLKYVGRDGNVIYYKLNGGYYTRIAPGKIKQTAATKIRSSNFAIAAGANRILRSLLQPAIPFPKDKKMQNRFGGAIMKWLQLKTPEQLEPATNLPYLQDFQFNEATSIRERWKVPLTVNKQMGDVLQLHIPAFIPKEKIAAPAWTNRIECTIAAASCNLKNSLTNGNSLQAFTIPYNDTLVPAQNIQLPVPLPAGSLVIVAVSLTYFVSKKRRQVPTGNIAFMPSGIVAAMYV
jgi:hypothetical protein